MALERKYSERFERIWAVYPKWPTGRSRKELAYKAFAAADRILRFTQDDIDQIIANIQARKKDCETWQRGNQYGPVGLQVYFNQHLWNEPYQKVSSRLPAYVEVARESAPREVASVEYVRETLADLKRQMGIRH